MQELLPIIQATLLEWAQLTLAQPFYAGALVATAGLFAAIAGSITDIPLKRRAAASERARVELTQELAAERQNIDALQARIGEQNHQLASSLQAASAGFDLGEQVSADGDELVQQHGRIIDKLGTLLKSERQNAAELRQAYQSETGKLAETEVLLASVQKELAEKARLAGGLEQQLNDVVAKHAEASIRIAELEQQALESDDLRQQLQALEQKLAEKEDELLQLQHRAEALQLANEAAAQARAAELAEAAVAASRARAHEAPAVAPEPVAEHEPVAEPEPMPSATITLADWDAEPKAVAPETPASQTKAAGGLLSGITGLFKNLFGKAKQDVAAPVEEVISEPVIEPISDIAEAVAEEAPSARAAQSQLAKLKSLLGLNKAEPSPSEAEVEEPALAEAVAESETEEAGGASVGYAKRQIGKISSLFGLAK